MQSSKIKIGEQYHIKSDAIAIPYGAYELAREPNSVRVIEKGIRRDLNERNDGIKVEITAEQYDPIMKYIDRDVERRNTPEQKMERRDFLRRRYPRQWIVSSRKIVESVSDAQKRIAAEERRRIEAAAWSEYEMREKAGKVTLAKVGEMIAQAERDVHLAARKYDEARRTYLRRIEQESERWAEVTEGEGYAIRLAEGQDVWPEADDFYATRAWDSLRNARIIYKEAQKRHADWVEMAKGND